MVCPCKSKSLLVPFSTWVSTGNLVSKHWAHKYPNFVAQSPPPLEMTLTVEFYHLCFSFVEALVPSISGTWYDNLVHTNFSVTLKEAEIFPVLLQIILSCFIFLRVCLWVNNRDYSEFCYISACNIVLCRIYFSINSPNESLCYLAQDNVHSQNTLKTIIFKL